jgi:regulator of sigma E protease
MEILIFILVLSFLVIIHELGHFFAAKWAGVKVEEFGIGYPPKAIKLFSWQGTDFTINWIPFGGFVRMAGEEQADAPERKKGDFVAAPLWKRLVVILAGASINFLFGVLAFTAIFSVMGIPTPIESARIAAVSPESPAAAAALPSDVEIIKLQSAETEQVVATPEDVISFIEAHRGQEVQITTTGSCSGLSCQESAQEFTVYIRTLGETPEGQGALGIMFQPVAFVQYPLWETPFRSAEYGVRQALFLGEQILGALRQLVVDVFSSGKVPSELAGPVGIVHQAQQSGILAEGWVMVLSFAGMLSINLAIMNVLPIPPLDGGRAVFILLELVFTRAQLLKVEHYLNYGGYFVLLALIILVTIRDVWRIFI